MVKIGERAQKAFCWNFASGSNKRMRSNSRAAASILGLEIQGVVMSKAIIEKYMDTLWNQKNLGIIEELFDEKAVIHSPLGQFRTAAEMKETVRKWIEAIPDIQVRLLHTLEDQQIVVSHWEAKGVHRKELNGLAGSGNPVQYQGVTMYRFENGKVVEYWAYLDSWSLEQQAKAARA